MLLAIRSARVERLLTIVARNVMTSNATNPAQASRSATPAVSMMINVCFRRSDVPRSRLMRRMSLIPAFYRCRQLQHLGVDAQPSRLCGLEVDREAHGIVHDLELHDPAMPCEIIAITHGQNRRI